MLLSFNDLPKTPLSAPMMLFADMAEFGALKTEVILLKS